MGKITYDGFEFYYGDLSTRNDDDLSANTGLLQHLAYLLQRVDDVYIAGKGHNKVQITKRR